MAWKPGCVACAWRPSVPTALRLLHPIGSSKSNPSSLLQSQSGLSLALTSNTRTTASGLRFIPSEGSYARTSTYRRLCRRKMSSRFRPGADGCQPWRRMTLGVERRYKRSVQKRVSEVLVVPADRAFRRLSDDLVVFPFGDLLEPAIAGAKRQKPARLVRLQAMNRFQESQQLVTQVNPLLLVFAPLRTSAFRCSSSRETRSLSK